MKHFLLSLLLGAGVAMLSAQVPTYQVQDSSTAPGFTEIMDSVFSLVDLSAVSSGILADRGFQYVPIEWYNGTLQPYNKLYYETWHGLYASMYTAAMDTNDRLPHPVGAYRQDQEALTEGSTIPLGMLYMDYHQLDTNSITDGLLAWNGIQLTDVYPRSRSPFLSRKLFGATPLLNSQLSGQVTFKLDSAYWFSNSGLTVGLIEVDFGDGTGFRSMAWQDTVTIFYPDSGNYLISTRLTFSNSSTALSHAHFRIDQGSSMARYGIVDTVIVHIPQVQGVHSGGKFTIAYGCGPTELDRPLIVVQGITVGGSGITYNGFIFQIGPLRADLRSNLEDEGYDLVYVEYNDGEDYIERNAYFLQDVIREVNAMKVGDEENVIMGVSMGGIVTRYALRDMEMADPNSLGSPTAEDHECRLYISYDSPHQGANVPLGLQHMVLHLASGSNVYSPFPIGWAVPGISTLVSYLNSPAARQLLVYHAFNAGPILFPPLSTPVLVTSPAHTALYNQLEVMGMPQETDENMAISNGSGFAPAQARDQGFGPGDEMFKISASQYTILPWWAAFLYSAGGNNLLVDFKINAVPDGNLHQIYRGVFNIKVLKVTVFTGARMVFADDTQPYDNAPGGAIPVSVYVDPADIEEMLLDVGVPGSIAAGVASSVNISADQFCYVPVVSALNVNEPQSQNLFFDARPSNLIPNGLTSFEQVKPVEATVPIPGQTTNGLNGNEDHTIYPTEIANWLITNMSLLPNASLNAGLTTQLTTTYNFGAGPVQRTTDRIIRPININQGGRLLVNRNLEVGPAGSGFNLPSPGSQFEVTTAPDNCNGFLSVNLNPLGLLEIGEPGGSLTGTLKIADGSLLQVNSTLRIHNNSRLIIEPGARLLIAPGAVIELNGTNAVLDIQGTLELMPGSVFTFTGSGHVRLDLPYQPGGQYPNVVLTNPAGAPAQIRLIGSGPTDKVLEIADGSYFTPNYQIGGWVIENGRVEIGDDAWIDTGNGDVRFVNSTFTALSQNQPYRTIFLNGQADLIIEDCTFEYGQTGLTARSYTSDGQSPTISTSIFQHCTVGLLTVDKGAHLHGCTFDKNGLLGWQMQNGVFSSTFDSNSKARSNFWSGIHYSGLNTLHMRKSSMTLLNQSPQYWGLTGYGDVELDLACNGIHDQLFGAVSLMSGADLTTMAFAGNDLSENANTIGLSLGGSLNLNGGYNNLIPVVEGDKHIVFGSTITYQGADIGANNNHWKSVGGAPVYNQDYVLTDAFTSTPIALADFFPQNQYTYPACEDEIGGSPVEPESLPVYPCAPDPCYIMQDGTFENRSTAEALEIILGILYDADGGFDDLQGAIEGFHDLLTYNYPNGSLSGFDYAALSYAWNRMFEAETVGIETGLFSGSPSSHTPNPTGAVATLLSALDALATRLPAEGAFLLKVDKAAIYAMIERTDLAKSRLDALEGEATNGLRKEYFDYWECFILQKRALLTGQATMNESWIEMQECQAAPAIMPDNPNRLPQPVTLEIPTNTWQAFPNPVDRFVTLQADLSGEQEVTIRVYDAQGRWVRTLLEGTVWPQGLFARNFDLGGLSAGLYMVQILAGDHSATLRMVRK